MNTIVYRTISLKTVLLALVSLISVNFFGQGEFLNRGINGFGVNGSFALASPSGENNYTNTGVGIGLGVSIGGQLDLQFEAGSLINENDDIKAKVISPGLAIHPIKQNEKIPISMRLTFSYGRYKYSGDELEKNILKMDGSSINCGLGLYRKLSLSSDQAIIPSVDAVYSFTTTTVINHLGNPMDIDDRFGIVIFSVPFTHDMSGKQVLYFVPSIAIGNKTTVISVALGFVLPFNITAPSNPNLIE